MDSEKEGQGDEGSGFCLRTGTDNFVSRTNDVFASLGALEHKHSAFLKAKEASSHREEEEGLLKKDPEEEEEESLMSSVDRDRRNRDNRSRSSLSNTRDTDYEPRSQSRSSERSDHPFHNISERQQRGRNQGNFRRPSRLPPRSGRQPLPEFKKHPEKFTCYSLGDVSAKDMSEQSNTRAALAFLEERRLQREKEDRKMAGLPEEEEKFDAGVGACSQGIIAFSRPKAAKREKCDESLCQDSTAASSKDKGSSLKTITPDSLDNNEVDIDGNQKVSHGEADIDTPTFSSTFRARKNVKRHIRKKGSDDDSD